MCRIITYEGKFPVNSYEGRICYNFISKYITLLVLYHLSSICLAADTTTYRTVHLEDLLDNPSWQMTHKQWMVPEFGSISRVALHLESNSLFVAVNNSVIRLSADTLEKLDEVSWSLTQQQSESCQTHSTNPNDCTPYLVSLLVPVDHAFRSVSSSLFRTGIYTCLSNRKTSECSLRQAADLRGPPKIHWKDPKQFLMDPETRVAATFASNRNLYVAGSFDENSSTVASIIRISEKTFNEDAMTSVQFARITSRSNWISQDERTTFIHSFEFHNAVYFLFREPAEELLEGCNKNIIVSRVGRICLTDGVGSNGLLQSFVKATIVCPGKNEDRAGPSSIVHTIIQSVHVDAGTKTLFAAFTTPRTMPASSVICEYHLTELEKTFEGPFHTLLGEHTKFNNPFSCQEGGRSTFTDANRYTASRLMYNVIRPRTDQPILMKEGTLWMHLSVDWVPHTPRNDNNLILFTMDSENVLIKWHLFKSEACIIEQVHMTHKWTGSGSGGTIHMQLIPDQNKPTLLLVTTGSVFRIPVSRCARFGHHEQTCALLHDPYCAWNRQTNQCQELNGFLEKSKQLTKYETCPPTNHEKAFDVTVDGAWGAWGPWSPCPMTSNRSLYSRWLRDSTTVLAAHHMEMFDPLVVNHCQCRYRYCSAPYRFGSGAKACPGDSAVQLANCSLDGMWTAWSSWSGCEPDCVSQQFKRNQMGNFGDGTGLVPLRSRQRWCTNPNPMGKLGKKCPDPGKETHVCPKPAIQCPDVKLSVPQWSRWSAWSKCSTACNGGMQLRWRKCGPNGQIEHMQPNALKLDLSDEMFLEKLHENHHSACLGQAYESRECNTQSCPVTKVTSSWTSWYVTEGNRQKGTRERRYRVECVATVPEVDKLQASIQLQKGTCHSDAAGKITCQDLGSEDKTKMESNAWPSPSENAWSEWASCSRPCGGGTRKRWRLKRVFSSPGQSQFGSPTGDHAPEAEREEEECNTHPCPGLWSCWTEWSKCTHPPCSTERGEQRRYRSCLIPSNIQLINGEQPSVDQCDGGEEQSVQSRPCEVTFEDLQCFSSSGMTSYDLTKRTIPVAQDESKLSAGRNGNSTTPWAEWSGCISVDGLPYGIQVRARERCDQCALVQAKRCDTHEPVSVTEILKNAPHLREGTWSAHNDKEQGTYGIGHAVVVGLCGAVLGVAVVLVPYLICLNRSWKPVDKQDRSQRSFVWRKLAERKPNSQRNLPYIWFADTDRSASEQAELKQMLLKRKPGTMSMEQPSMERENLVDCASAVNARASMTRSMPYQNASLTRIQALHNDHRNPVMPKSTSPLSLQEPIISWDTSVAENGGLDPVSVDSSPTQQQVDKSRQAISSNSLLGYNSLVNGTEKRNAFRSATKTHNLINAQTTHDDDIIYASAPCS